MKMCTAQCRFLKGNGYIFENEKNLLEKMYYLSLIHIWELSICPIDDHMDIAGFVMFSDVEITEKTAQALLEKCPEHDVICLLYTSRCV